ncbi:glycosyltransferase, partial [Candidatus Saccharibacteria bacterium]|nr:glycosyltransferase [Candidatus Saccharibacteria bacterium]
MGVKFEMRVFIVARGYPTDKYKMNGIFEFDQAKALARAGVDVVYAAVDVRSLRRWRKWGLDKKTIEGVRVYAVNIPCGRVPKRLLRLISVITLRRLFSRIVKKYGRPDIVHSHFINQGYFTVSALKKEGVPIVHTEHYSGMNKTTLD